MYYTKKRKSIKSLTQQLLNNNLMNTNRIKLLTFLLSAVVLVTACDKDDEAPLSADDAQAALASVDSELTVELENLSEAKGFTALADLSDLSGAGDPFPILDAAGAQGLGKPVGPAIG